MSWMRRLFARRGRPERHTAFWLYVRCHRCGEAIRVRTDRRYDLVSELRDPGESGPAYTMHKDIVGDRCFQRISVDLGFDRGLQIVERHITGGDFLSETEYATAIAAEPPADLSSADLPPPAELGRD